MINAYSTKLNTPNIWPDSRIKRLNVPQYHHHPTVKKNNYNILINENVYQSHDTNMSASNHKNQFDLNKFVNLKKNLSFYFNDVNKSKSLNKNHNNSNNDDSMFYSISNLNQQRKNSFKFNTNQSNASNDKDLTDLAIDLSSIEFGKLLKSKKVNRDTAKMILRNQSCLSILVEGDLIEYVKDENDIEGNDHLRNWAIYMGNSMIMRFDVGIKSIIYESYWKLACKFFIFINREFDKRLCTLPIYEILKRARKAFENKSLFVKKFSSDKNFAMWCRFDLNKSDIDIGTEQNGHSSVEAKNFVLDRFLNSLDQAEEKVSIGKNSKSRLTFLFHENQKLQKKPKHSNLIS